MSVRVTEHTRRDPGGHCFACNNPIKPGEVYRQRVIMYEELIEGSFERRTAHRSCVSWYEEWALQNSEAPDRREARLQYVRKTYGSWYRVGVKVWIQHRDETPVKGTIYDGDGKYVVVRSSKLPKGGNYHAHDLKPRGKPPAVLPEPTEVYDDIPF